MAKLKFGARFAVITADLEEYLVSCPVPLLPLVWIPACAFTTPHLRGSGVSLAPSCGVRGSFIFIAGLVLQRPSRERISSPRAATVCARLPGSTRRRRDALGLREELRISRTGTRGLLAEEDNGVIERSNRRTSPYHHRLAGRPPRRWLVPQRVMTSPNPLRRGAILNERSRAIPSQPARRRRNG